jgi:putative PIN family toxin of toxin-antitoxin system
MRRIVIDTNVLVASLRSDQGASFRLISLLGKTSRFEACISVPLILEYEEVLSRDDLLPSAPLLAKQKFLNYICAVTAHCEIFYLWRPLLQDPDDEMLVELAMAGNCDTLITYNQRDLAGAKSLGLRIQTPKEFLAEIGELS